MNKKFSSLTAPSMRLYFFFLVIFAIVSFFFNRDLALVECAIIVILFIQSRFATRRRQADLLEYIENVTLNLQSVSKDTLLNFPLPMVIFRIDNDEVIWSNDSFLKITGEREHFFESKLGASAPGFTTKWLLEGKNACPDLIEIRGRKYQVYGNIARTDEGATPHRYLGTTYWMDVTDYADIRDEYNRSRTVTAIILMDNYDELFKNMPEKQRSVITGSIDDKISDWAEGTGGYLCKFERDRYVFILEERHLEKYIEKKFSLLDSVREITNPSGIHATISIGIGKDSGSLAENYQYAALGLEMALSRGGDQAVIKNRYNFEFFGGRSAELEKQTKVKSRVMASALGELIADATYTFVMGHKLADLDSVGAAVGICCIARGKGERAHIVIDLEKNHSKALIEKLQAMPEYEDTFISPREAILMADSKSLLVVVDTNRPDQVESEGLLMACNKVVVIDHHRRAAEYIQNAALNFHEPYASSTSELVSELLQYLVKSDDILRVEADALLSGIVLDTKNFTIRTGGGTFDAAAFLRRAGADTVEVKKLLQNDLEGTVARYNVIQQAKIYRESIAIAAMDSYVDRIIAAQAADELLGISGVGTSFVLYPEEDMVVISARSIGDMNVQVVLEKLGGGGNKSSAGAQIKDKSLEETLETLLRAIEDYLKEKG